MSNQANEQASGSKVRPPKIAWCGLALAWGLNAAYFKWPRIPMFALIVAWVLATLFLTILLVKKPKLRNLSWITVLGLFAALAFPTWSTLGRRNVTTSDVAAIRGIVSSEELILALSPTLNHVRKGVLNLQLADQTFADSLVVYDLFNQGDGTWRAGSAESRLQGAEIWSALMD